MRSICAMYLTVSALAGVLLCSCRTLGGQPRSPFDQTQIDKRSSAFDKDRFDNCMTALQKKADDADQCRNSLITDQLDVIDYVYNQFKVSVFKTSGLVDITGDLLSGALSGASTITGGQQAKTVLSGIATVITGSKSSIDKNLFLQQSAHVLIGRMDALRIAALKPIRVGLLQPSTNYPVWQAVRDVQSYLSAGSLGAAITDIENNSGKAAADANEATQQQITEKYGADSNTYLLAAFWLPDGHTVNQKNQTALEQEMAALKVPSTVHITDFLNTPTYAKERARAVTDLKLSQ
jgi:hypothetical protein